MAKFWLIKSEPQQYSIDDLKRDGTTHWDGVRNYQARNFMRDEMQVGDRVLFYHSNAEPLGIAGIAEVCREAYPDFTSWQPGNPHYDPKSTEAAPRWFMVDIAFVERFSQVVPLAGLREQAALAGMLLLNKSRLSVQPVTREEFETIVALGRAG